MTGPDTERDTLEELASEFAARLRQGEQPDVEDYAARYPDLAEEVRELFPTIELMEKAKAGRGRSSDGRASLGASRPERLGDYRILGEVGRGGMGIVYEAEQESLGRRVALKVLPRQALLDARQIERFHREARTVARLHHTNIVPIFGVGEQDGFHYYVMPLIRGAGLDEVLRQLHGEEDGPAERRDLRAEAARALTADRPVGPDYWRNVARVGVQAAEALHAAHGQGVLHRDVKPANLLLEPDGHLWVSDFGLAKALEADGSRTSGNLVGTLPYVAPEVFRGAYDTRSDVYGLGLTLYELLTLQPAFRDPDRGLLIHRITQGDLTPPRRLQPDLPRDLETVVLKASAREPEHRYATAQDLADDLRRFVEGRPVVARRLGPLTRLARWGRRNPAIAALTLAVLLLLAVVAGVSTSGYLTTRRALEGESRERQKAEATAVLALEALDRTFARFAPRGAGTPAGVTLVAASGETIEVATQPALSAETADFLKELLSCYDRLAEHAGGSATLRRATARANLRVGDINQRLGRSSDALAAYGRATDLYRALLADDNSDPSLRTEIALVLNEMGSVHRLMRRPEEARRAHREALELIEPAATSPEALFELARTCYFLGRPPFPDPGPRPFGPPGLGGPPMGGPHRDGGLPLDRPPRGFGGGPPGRRIDPDALRRAVALLADLEAAHPSRPSYRHLTACCLRELGQDHTRVVLILERLCEESPGVPEYLNDLCEVYAEVDPRGPDGDARAIEQLRKALEVSERLNAAHPHVPAYLATQVQVRARLAAVLRRTRNGGEAEQQLRKAIELQTTLAQGPSATPSGRTWLAMLQFSLADMLSQRGAWREAAGLWQTAAALLEDVRRTEPDVPFHRAILSDVYARLATAYGELREPLLQGEARRRADELRPGPGRERGPFRGLR